MLHGVPVTSWTNNEVTTSRDEEAECVRDLSRRTKSKCGFQIALTDSNVYHSTRWYRIIRVYNKVRGGGQTLDLLSPLLSNVLVGGYGPLPPPDSDLTV